MVTENTTASSAATDSAFSLMLTDAFKIPSAFALTCLSFIGAVSNLLTIVSFNVDKKLRKRVYDFFIFNLAVTDFFICSVVIPIYIIYLMKEVWPYGRGVCKFWLVMDYTMCNEATVTILILSADRLLMFRLGPRYHIVVTMRRALLVAVSSWTCILLIYGSCVIWWHVWRGQSFVHDTECHPEFSYESTFTTTMSLIDTIIPLVGLVTTNGLMYYKLWVRNRPESLKYLGRYVSENCSYHASTQLTSFDPTVTSWDSALSEHSTEMPSNVTDITTISRKRQQPCRCRYTQGSRSNVKAAKFLSSLVVVYVICWGPYTVTSVMVSLFGEGCIHPVAYQVIFWWLWVKSAVNPFLYSYNSKRYRTNFTNLLTCLYFRRNQN